MKYKDDSGRVHQTMHAVFKDGKQITAWRTCRLKTLAALHRSSHHTNKKWTRPKLVNGKVVEVPQVGEPPVRNRSYQGASLVTRVFITPARQKVAA